jgi:hypothetical protein
VQTFLADGAASVGCPVDLLAVPFLVYAAAANGRQRRLQIKQGWVRKSTLWGAVVARSGDGKSPADSYARAPLDILQAEADELYQEALTTFKRDLAKWKTTDPDARGDEPTPPLYPHWFTTDPTVESLAPMLQGSSGIAASFDELIAWIRGCNSYKKGGNDRQKYLELWNGRALKIDRRTQAVLYVKDPVCCLGGGIQPERLPELARDSSVFDGLLQRFIWTYPDVTPSTWTWADRDTTHLDAMVTMFRQLRLCAEQTLTIHPDARARWAAWYDENLRERQHLPPLAQEMASKMPAHLATLWLVLHCLWDPHGTTSQVRLAQLDEAIALVEYFRSHARRVMAHFGTTAPHVNVGLIGRVAAILRGAGDWITQSDIWHGLHRNGKAVDLATALGALEADGRAEHRVEGTGGKATTWWRWIPEPAEEEGFAESDSSDSYESTNQALQTDAFTDLMTSDSFNSYESATTPLADRTGTPIVIPQTCCVCGRPLEGDRTYLCETCSEEMAHQNRRIFGESPEDVA